jgi:hypothetical protein
VPFRGKTKREQEDTIIRGFPATNTVGVSLDFIRDKRNRVWFNGFVGARLDASDRAPRRSTAGRGTTLMVNHPRRNRSLRQRLLAIYSDLGLTAEDSDRQYILRRLHQMDRLPDGSADLARVLLDAIRTWNDCYDRKTGYLSSGTPYEHDCHRRVERLETQFIERFLGIAGGRES